MTMNTSKTYPYNATCDVCNYSTVLRSWDEIFAGAPESARWVFILGVGHVCPKCRKERVGAER